MKLTITSETILGLKALRSERKFEAAGFYPGAPSEEIRVRCESWINDLLDRLVSSIARDPQKSYVISQFLVTLENFGEEDTEEREQACTYLEHILDAVGIESSDGVLNEWLYGFNPEKEA